MNEKHIENFVYVAVEYLSDYKDDGKKSFPYDGDIHDKEQRHVVMEEINKRLKAINPKLKVESVGKSAYHYLELTWSYTL